MKLDIVLPFEALLMDTPQIARSAEEIGFDAIWTAETQHDPFLPGPLIAEHTTKVHFGTAIAVGFARSPGNLAYLSWDLAAASAGRFILGLGTQVKPHIERRFGMPWPESPLGLLREQIAAIRALWSAWQTGDRLNYRGSHYKLTLMTPFFNPGPIEFPDIPIYIAGVNPGMAHLAGEVADGFHAHPLNSVEYLKQVIAPAIEKGASTMGRQKSEIPISLSAFVITDAAMRESVRQQISFYASTPSYRRVMSLHGWDAAAEKLTGLAAKGRWEEMAGLVDDEMLDTFAVSAAPHRLADVLVNRFYGVVDRVTPYLPFRPRDTDGFWKPFVREFRQAVQREV